MNDATAADVEIDTEIRNNDEELEANARYQQSSRSTGQTRGGFNTKGVRTVWRGESGRTTARPYMR